MCLILRPCELRPRAQGFPNPLFQALKRRGRTAEELPNEVKIDCLTVNCVPAKNAVEQLLQNLFEALLNCLKRSVQADLVAADAFLSGDPFTRYHTCFLESLCTGTFSPLLVHKMSCLFDPVILYEP